MSKENKPAKVAKPNKVKKSGGGIGKFFLALVMAVIVFVALIVLQTGITNKYEKKGVVIAKVDIPANTDITAANVDEFFGTIDYDVTKLPDLAVKTEQKDSLINTITLAEIPKGQIVTEKSYISRDTITGDLARLSGSDLVEYSFAVDSIADAVAGTIRRGDIVDIYLFYSDVTDGKELMDAPIEKVVLDGIHIKQAYDSSGAAIVDGDEGTAASMFDIVASRDDVDELNGLLLKKMRGGYLKMTIVKTNDVAF